MASTPVFDITPPAFASMPYQDVSTSQRAPRSKLKNFFGRRRLSPSPGATSKTSTNDEEDGTTSFTQSDRRHLSVFSKPSLMTRTKSDTAVLQTTAATAKTQHSVRTSSRVAAGNENKTFLYAYSKASLRCHARTLSPTVPDKSSHSSGNQSIDIQPTQLATSSNRVDSSEASLAEDKSHTANPAAVLEKLFVLGQGFEILQFDATGDPDRLPERVLKLNADSLVCPSDVSVGRGMALEIFSTTDTLGQARPKTNRSTWSRNPFRASVTKRTSDNLVMIFDDVDVMSTWVTSIRQAVGSVGGRSSRPHSAWAGAEKPLPQLRSTSTERLSMRQSFLQLSRSSSSLSHDFSEASNALAANRQVLLPVPPQATHSRSTSTRSHGASSINTNTSLDRLRESDSHSTTTGTTNSLDGSVALDSPIKETLANITSPSVSMDSRTTAFADPFPAAKATLSSAQTLRERRKPSVAQLRLGNASNVGSPSNNLNTRNESENKSPRSPAFEDQVNTAMEGDGKARPISILAPLPSPDEIRKPPKLFRVQSAGCVEILDRTKATRPASSHEGHRSKPSADATNKSMYSLFPKKRVEAPKTEPLVVPEADNIPGLPQSHATDHLTLPPTPTVAITPAMSPASSRNSSKKPSPIRLLAALEMDQPLRSPAVTADMLASNFGTQGNKIEPSPITPTMIKVPTFEDLKFDFSFLKDDYSAAGRRRSDSPTSERDEGRVRKMKSTPSLRVSRAASAPLGPPPSGPLPAVPAVPSDDSAVRSNTSSPKLSEHRQSKQSRSNSPSSSSNQVLSHEPVADSTPNPSSGSMPQPSDPPPNESPLAPVGMPSIISPPPVPTQTHSREKSANKSVNSTKSHRRTKSSGKYSLGVNIKAFPSAPMLCDKPSSFYC